MTRIATLTASALALSVGTALAQDTATQPPVQDGMMQEDMQGAPSTTLPETTQEHDLLLQDRYDEPQGDANSDMGEPIVGQDGTQMRTQPPASESTPPMSDEPVTSDDPLYDDDYEEPQGDANYDDGEPFIERDPAVEPDAGMMDDGTTETEDPLQSDETTSTNDDPLTGTEFYGDAGGSPN